MTNREAIKILDLMINLDHKKPVPNRDLVIEAIQMAIKALEAQEWVPVSERLPEDVEIGEEYPTVIFSTKDAVYCGFYEYYYGGNWWAAEDYIVNDVIAWKPLPEPYREDEE